MMEGADAVCLCFDAESAGQDKDLATWCVAAPAACGHAAATLTNDPLVLASNPDWQVSVLRAAKFSGTVVLPGAYIASFIM